MAGLRIKLNAGERILINGVIVRNGPKQSCVTIETTQSNILRLKEAIDGTRADTPAKLLWLLAQSIVAGMVDKKSAKSRLISGLLELRREIGDPSVRLHADTALQAIHDDNFYLALRATKRLSMLIDEPCGIMFADTDEISVKNLISTEC